MHAGLWVAVRGEFVLWFYPTYLFHSAEHGTEAKFEEHHDPEVPEGGRRKCYQCSRQIAAGGRYLHKQGELIAGPKIKHAKGIVGSWHPAYKCFFCMLLLLLLLIQDKVGWVQGLGRATDGIAWCDLWIGCPVAQGKQHLNCSQSEAAKSLWQLFLLPTSNLREVADIFH